MVPVAITRRQLENGFKDTETQVRTLVADLVESRVCPTTPRDWFEAMHPVRILRSERCDVIG